MRRERAFGQTVFFAFIAFGTLFASGAAHAEGNPCTLSSQARDKDVKNCLKLHEQAEELQAEVGRANLAYQQASAKLTFHARTRAGGDHADAAVGSNEQGRRLHEAAAADLKKLEEKLRRLKEGFEKNKGKLVGAPSRFLGQFRGNGLKWSEWYFESCQLSRIGSNC